MIVNLIYPISESIKVTSSIGSSSLNDLGLDGECHSETDMT